jgi:L-ascorbate metabolism protein UlaG (beta-lactamase superfamily)
MRRATWALAFVAACACACGCTASRFLGGTAAALFGSPRAVPHTVADPVRADARLSALWIGHATVLLQIDDRFVLTDPVFTSTVGMLTKRLVEPGLEPRKLPKLDVVLVSHVHFDHLSLGSLAEIEPKIGSVVLPEGGTAYLTDFGFPAVELRTWQAWDKDGLRVTAVPVAHVGGRYGIDRAWLPRAFTAYVLEYHGIVVYFGGDSGYERELFAATRARFPAIDLALLPISPLEPREAMRAVHMDPHDAVEAFLDLGARAMVPIHFDTFANPEDPPGGALRELRAAAARVPRGQDVIPLAIGEQRVLVAR